MVIFVLDHSQGKVLKVSVPKELEYDYDNDAGHENLVMAVREQFPEKTTDFIITDYEDIIEETLKIPELT